MKINNYKLFLESKETIDSICQKYGIENYTINDDGIVDVDGNVNLYHTIDFTHHFKPEALTKLPLKFGRVTGYFDCGRNKLKSLEGSPKYVGTYFSCENNELTTLEGGPEVVIGIYYCNNNQLVNFKGFPEDYDNSCSFDGNPIYYRLLKDITLFSWNKFIYWCNEYNAITDEGKVIPERMEEVYNKLGLKYVD